MMLFVVTYFLKKEGSNLEIIGRIKILVRIVIFFDKDRFLG